LTCIKHPDSEAGLLRLLEVELSEDVDLGDAEREPLTDNVLRGLTALGSVAGLQESRRLIAEAPEHPEVLGLCEALLATSVMCGVTLPEDKIWRGRLNARDRRLGDPIEMLGGFGKRLRDNWRRTGMSFPEEQGSGEMNGGDDDWDPPQSSSLAATSPFDSDARVEPIRNTAPKTGRNDPCPCRSGKKYKKCCGNK
jgi:hypothetical protein